MPAVVLNHITVIDVATTTARRDILVVTRAGRIAAVGRAEAIEVAPGAEAINLTGKFLIPGLVDMHNHLGPGEARPGPPRPGARGHARHPSVPLADGSPLVS